MAAIAQWHSVKWLLIITLCSGEVCTEIPIRTYNTRAFCEHMAERAVVLSPLVKEADCKPMRLG